MIRSETDKRRFLEPAKRKGAALVEAAISLTVLLSTLIFVLDFSIASFRSQSLNYLAERLAREASVHGNLTSTTWRGGPWGPATFNTTLDGTDPIAVLGRTFCNTLPGDEVSITITWPTGSNEMGNPVVVSVEMPWTPSMFRPVTQSVMTLRGVSRQTIAH